MKVPTVKLYAADAHVRSLGVLLKLALIILSGAIERDRPACVMSCAAQTTNTKTASWKNEYCSAKFGTSLLSGSSLADVGGVEVFSVSKLPAFVVVRPASCSEFLS